MSRAVVLLSGGLDSTVCVAKAVSDGMKVTALSFRYGQKHNKELESAKAVANYYGIDHLIVDLDLSSFKSALTRTEISIPENRDEEIGNDIPVTYVPARNIIMLSVAAGLCESLDADRIYIGVNSVDYSGYPDCRPEFIASFQETISKGTKAGVEGNPIQIVTPIQHFSKSDIVKLGKELDAPLHLTWSCYEGGEEACGKCDSCILRLQGFKEAGFQDEIRYHEDK